MAKRVVSCLLSILMLTSASLALAGGAQVAYPPPACAPAGPYAGGGNPCAFWGDAPFPGMCGGVVALPFLVVGSLLGGNTTGPYPPAPGPGPYYPPRFAGPQPWAGPVAPFAPVARPVCGPPAGAGPFGGSILGGLPCLELCAGIFGGVTGGFGLGL
ncbi:MAG: hypothetical protein WCG29_12360 [Desulfomonile sp.]|jgi:hypothetical protein|nr:hypothetical protein [Deltaproteobacteria bacterium]